MSLEYAHERLPAGPYPIYDYIWGTADGTIIAGVQFTSHVLVRSLLGTQGRVRVWFGGKVVLPGGQDDDQESHTALVGPSHNSFALPIMKDGLVSVESLDGVPLEVAIDRVAGIAR